jgi:hypothetical protein
VQRNWLQLPPVGDTEPQVPRLPPGCIAWLIGASAPAGSSLPAPAPDKPLFVLDTPEPGKSSGGLLLQAPREFHPTGSCRDAPAACDGSLAYLPASTLGLPVGASIIVARHWSTPTGCSPGHEVGDIAARLTLDGEGISLPVSASVIAQPPCSARGLATPVTGMYLMLELFCFQRAERGNPSHFLPNSEGVSGTLLRKIS